MGSVLSLNAQSQSADECRDFLICRGRQPVRCPIHDQDYLDLAFQGEFDSPPRILMEEWRMEYNLVRAHSSLGYRPPAPEATVVWSPA
jgi:hypothetical protein